MTLITGYEFKLRAGAPMNLPGGPIQQTFGVDKFLVEIEPVTETISKSSEFSGQGGSLISATFNRLPDKSGLKFSSRKVYKPTFEDESAVA